jgi:hypothetical protein
VVDALGPEEPPAPVGQVRHLVLVGDVERVDVVARHPYLVAVRRLRCQLDRLAVHRRGDPRELDGLLGDPPRGVRVEVDVRSEAPAAVRDDAYGEAQRLGVDARLEPAVAQGDGRRAVPLDAYVGVLDTELARTGQGRVGDGAQRK